MCRSLISLGRISDIFNYYGRLVNSLIKASEYDPYNIALFGPDDISHDDGWGRLFIKVGSDKVEMVLKRSTAPIFIDKPKISLGEADQNAIYVDIVHSRDSSIGMPINLFSVHPFETETRCGYLLYLVHNGAVKKDIILDWVGVDKNSDHAKLYTDSYFLARYIAMNICDSLSPHPIREASRIVDGGLNLGVVLVTDNYIDVLVGSYYVPTNKPKETRDFYKMYRARLGDTVIYVSSTLIDFEEYNPRLPVEWDEVNNGTYDVYRLWVSRGIVEHLYTFNV